MSSSKHTPGEWDVNEFNDLDGDHHVTVVAKSNGCPLAHMYEAGRETRANARLMAAAPTTAEMAMAFTLLVERYVRGDEIGAAPVSESDLADAMYGLRAHIAEAVGV